MFEIHSTILVTLVLDSDSEETAHKEVSNTITSFVKEASRFYGVTNVEIKETSAPQEFFPYKISFGFGELTVWARNRREAKQKFLCSITESIAEIEEVK